MERFNIESAIIVFGAADPEQALAERIAEAVGLRIGYACIRDTKSGVLVRCHAGNASKATSVALEEWTPGREETDEYAKVFQSVDFVGTTDVIIFECGGFSPNYFNWCPEEDDRDRGMDMSISSFRPRFHKCDHYNPGDPGFGKEPEEYFEASSLGQFLCLLVRQDLVVQIYELWRVCGTGYILATSQDVRFTTAADHCLEAAYRGKCPGVDPEGLMGWRAAQKAVLRRKDCQTCHGTAEISVGRLGCAGCGSDDHPDCYDGGVVECPDCSVSAVKADIEKARKILREAMECQCSECGRGSHMSCVAPNKEYADLRKAGERQCAECKLPRTRPATPMYCETCKRSTRDHFAPIPELPEAACREGIPFVANVTERDGKKKCVLQAATPELVERFKSGELIPGLKNYYGSPQRGLAGGYYD